MKITSGYKRTASAAGLMVVLALCGAACAPAGTSTPPVATTTAVTTTIQTTATGITATETPDHLLVSGRVATPLDLSYEDVLRYPAVTETAILYCAGVFENEPDRDWYGVPVTAILESAGVQPEATRLIFHASDGYKTTLSIDRVAETGAILAYQVDGAILSEGDGYPFRLVSPELEGEMWIRWLSRIEVV